MNAPSMRMAPATLAGLVAARMCHDLVSPLGAVGNGIELMQMAGGDATGQGGELDLVVDSLAAARGRVQAFRMAFGPAGKDQRLSRADLAQLLAEAGGRLKVELEAEGDLPRADAKMILLALMCLETAMPWGGRVLVCRATPVWRLVAEATRTRQDPALWSWLGLAEDEDTAAMVRSHPMPAEVQFPLLFEEARAHGRELRWELDDHGAEISF